MNALFLVDVQNDFLPGGALPVVKGDRIIPIINQLLTYPFDLVVASKDWHPPGHCSFASTHHKEVGEKVGEQVLWPDHCVQNTPGADFPKELQIHTVPHRVYKKGILPHVDCFSGFFDHNRERSTGLHDDLQAKGVDTLFIVGLATDYCVKVTAIDAAELGYTTYVIPEGVAPVALQPDDERLAWEEMERAGVHILPFDQVEATL